MNNKRDHYVPNLYRNSKNEFVGYVLFPGIFDLPYELELLRTMLFKAYTFDISFDSKWTLTGTEFNKNTGMGNTERRSLLLGTLQDNGLIEVKEEGRRKTYKIDLRKVREYIETGAPEEQLEKYHKS